MNLKGHISQAILAFGSLPYMNKALRDHNFCGDLRIYDTLLLFIDKARLDFSNIYSIPLTLAFLMLALFGAKFPDFDLFLSPLFDRGTGMRRYKYHRQFTHSVLLWSVAMWYALYTYNIFLFYFSFGGIVHLLGDMLTGSVPYLLWGRHYNFFARIGIDRLLWCMSARNRQYLFMGIAKSADMLAPIAAAAGIYLLFARAI